jgi:hypothetical protein
MAAMDPSDLSAFCDRVLFGQATAYAADTREELNSAPTDALLSHDILLGSVMAAEATGTPSAMLSPHVSIPPLPGVPHVGSSLASPRTDEERAEVEMANRRFASFLNGWLPALNNARTGQGLAPLTHVFDHYSRPDAAGDQFGIRLPCRISAKKRALCRAVARPARVVEAVDGALVQRVRASARWCRSALPSRTRARLCSASSTRSAGLTSTPS